MFIEFCINKLEPVFGPIQIFCHGLTQIHTGVIYKIRLNSAVVNKGPVEGIAALFLWRSQRGSGVERGCNAMIALMARGCYSPLRSFRSSSARP